MIITTPDKLVMKMIWDAGQKANGRPVNIDEIARKIHAIQEAGMSVYPADTVEEIKGYVREELGNLKALGVVGIDGDETELTAVGQLIAANFEFPSWAKH